MTAPDDVAELLKLIGHFGAMEFNAGYQVDLGNRRAAKRAAARAFDKIEKLLAAPDDPPATADAIRRARVDALEEAWCAADASAWRYSERGQGRKAIGGWAARDAIRRLIPASVIPPDFVINADGTAIQRSFDDMTSAGSADDAAGPAAASVCKESLHAEPGAVSPKAAALVEAMGEALEPLWQRAIAPGAALAADDERVTVFMKDCRDALAAFRAWKAGGGFLAGREEAGDGR